MESSREVDLSVLGRPSTQRRGQKRPRTRYDLSEVPNKRLLLSPRSIETPSLRPLSAHSPPGYERETLWPYTSANQSLAEVSKVGLHTAIQGSKAISGDEEVRDQDLVDDLPANGKIKVSKDISNVTIVRREEDGSKMNSDSDYSSTRLHVGNLARDTTKQDIEEHFSSHGTGKITEITLMNGYGFVEFEDPRDARDIVPAFHGSEMKGNRITVQYADLARHKENFLGTAERAAPRPRRSIYRMVVENLAPDISWQDLKDFVNDLYPVDVVYCEIGRASEGKGFVEFETQDDLETAVTFLDGREWKGSIVICKKDDERSDSPPNGYQRTFHRDYSSMRKDEESTFEPRLGGTFSISGNNTIMGATVLSSAAETFTMSRIFVCHTISEDLTGSQESVFSHSLAQKELDPMDGVLPIDIGIPRRGQGPNLLASTNCFQIQQAAGQSGSYIGKPRFVFANESIKRRDSAP